MKEIPVKQVKCAIIILTVNVDVDSILNCFDFSGAYSEAEILFFR